MHIKMIVTDLDDTFLKNDKTISDRSLRALSGCKAAGIKTAFATARGGSVARIGYDKHFDGIATSNGAIAYIDKKPVYKRIIAEQKVQKLYSSFYHSGLKAGFENDTYHYCNYEAEEKWPGFTDYIIISPEEAQGDASKVYALVESQADIDIVESMLDEMLCYKVARDGMAMIMNSEATKPNATAALAKHWGFGLENAVAFGDDLNDIELLQSCGLGVAMANARDEVKVIADIILPHSNEEDGVAIWIEENLLAGKQSCGLL